MWRAIRTLVVVDTIDGLVRLAMVIPNILGFVVAGAVWGVSDFQNGAIAFAAIWGATNLAYVLIYFYLRGQLHISVEASESFGSVFEAETGGSQAWEALPSVLITNHTDQAMVLEPRHGDALPAEGALPLIVMRGVMWEFTLNDGGSPSHDRLGRIIRIGPKDSVHGALIFAGESREGLVFRDLISGRTFKMGFPVGRHEQ